MSYVSLISQAMVAGGLTGARPFLSLLVLALAVRYIAQATPPDDVAWLLSPYAMLGLGVLSWLEHEARTEPDFEEALRRPLQVLSIVAGVLAGRLLSATQEVSAVAGGGAAAGAPGVLTAGHSGTAVLLIALAVASSLIVQELRRRALSALEDLLDLQRIWRLLEAGGVAGVIVAIVLLPFIAAVLVVLLTLIGAAVGLAARRWQAAAEARRRYPCPSCNHKVREEALLCPGCREALEPRRWLSL